MLRVSFRLVASGSFPCSLRAKRSVLLVTAALLAGCGASAASKSASKPVRGRGYSFAAPGSWDIARAGRTVSASKGEELVSVTVFPLARRYTPQLWASTVPVLDGVAAQLAQGLNGRVESRETVILAGRRSRRYELAFERGETELRERIAFVLDGRREYELLCRFRRDHASAGKRCDAFLESFRPG
jgi:hypothetical protein